MDFSPEILNFYTDVKKEEEIYDENSVKVVVSSTGKAIYFSRYSIPYRKEKTKRDDRDVVVYKQLGIYSFSPRFLETYASLPMSSLEAAEGIGLLRFLENDIPVHMEYTKYDSHSVDTPEDLEIIKEQFFQDR